MEERKLTDEEIVKDIERSTGMPSYWKKIVLDLINRQKAEIERLTEAHKKDTMLLYASGLACEQVKAENAELRKQVDELKAKQVIECHGMLKGCDMVKQAVKDTAKEIYHLIDMFPIPTRQGQQRYATGFENGLTAIKLKIAERFGVEVE